MSNRHIGRTIALQTLFELDMRKSFSLPKEEVAGIIGRDIKELAEGYNDSKFVEDLVLDVQKRLITLDDIIVRAAPDWPIEKINTVDRNILRLGLCELLFGDRKEVPPKVAIDEAIELAKTFGGETSGKFVNGVLGAIYKEMGEPQKGETSKKAPIVSREYLAGAVVFCKAGKELKFALVHDVFGYWTLTKGHIDPTSPQGFAGQEVEEQAKKKIKSEIGVSVELKTILGENEYIANKPEIGKVVKHVRYYLAESEYMPLTLEKKGGLDDAKWFTLEEAKELRMYDDILPMIEKGIEFLNNPKK